MKNLSLKSIMLYGLLTTSWMGLSACGGGGGSDTDPGSPPPPTTSTGIFVDSLVSGLSYTTASQSGITDANGNYDYIDGETVTFSIGGIVLGSATAGPVVTPLSLVSGATDATDPTVTNIVKLLLTLDADGNPDNGIEITSATTAAASGVTFDFNVTEADFDSNTAVVTFVTNATGSPVLVDATTAQTHFAASLESNWGVMAWGTGQWSSN